MSRSQPDEGGKRVELCTDREGSGGQVKGVRFDPGFMGWMPLKVWQPGREAI